jgi:hypothetical protein
MNIIIKTMPVLLLALAAAGAEVPAAKPAAPVPAKPAEAVPMTTMTWDGDAKTTLVPFLHNEAGQVRPRKVADNRWEFPAGKYTFAGYSYTEDGRTVVVKIPVNKFKIETTPDKPLEIKRIAEIKASAFGFKKPDGTVDIRLSGKADGNIVYCAAGQGTPPSQVGFRVLDAAGKEIYSGKFEFG